MMVAVAGEGQSESCMESMEREEKSERSSNTTTAMNRKDKRKALKKMKRKQTRRQNAMRVIEEEDARLNDPEELTRLMQLEQEEAERMERDRKEFEEREREFLEALLQRNREEEEQRELLERNQRKQVENENPEEMNEDDNWEYIEEGPAEIIWQGNEIIVRKKKVRVLKKDVDKQTEREDIDRPTSNPLAPQSEAFEDYKSAQELLESVAQQVPNFGTEQDKAHCPFHLKTGACRFGARCSRVHFYPDKSCTLLMKNMYGGSGLAWDQDEGLEYTDEEIKCCFEDFYEDVHTEFLKFGEIVNFKVCNNSSSHLRGNVYVHYQSLESAVLACQSINGRYFAGKQVTCEFVNVTRWKVAICGEFMKSRLKTCSRGSACNFIHCFRNPGGDYEWADLDKPPPRYWVQKMAALFGYTDGCGNQLDKGSPGPTRSSSKRMHADIDRTYRSWRSRSKELESGHRKSHHEEADKRRTTHLQRHASFSRKRAGNFDYGMHEEGISSKAYQRIQSKEADTNSDESRSSGNQRGDPELMKRDGPCRAYESDSDSDWSDMDGASDRHHEHKSKSSKFTYGHEYTTLKPLKLDMKQTASHADRGCSRHRSSTHRKKNSDVSNVDLQGDGLDGYEERLPRNSSRWLDDTADMARGGSYGNEDRHRKHSRINSTSCKGLDESEVVSLRERDEEKHGKHRRRSSRRQSKESGFSDTDSHAGKPRRDQKRSSRRNQDRSHDKKKSRCSNSTGAWRPNWNNKLTVVLL
ncbi:hypothetical protein Nepgr_027507 [Nepenthes gracilis]|uniref:Zinc finger CCCH domain-containing protein 5 n=1 Tax=Nepenthes gracilis TaxID=150966 RepID=A0AAD3Y364_NEPGR|nr:hypothetical protein Nepgr_027507 [Nepenthes gracilis]